MLFRLLGPLVGVMLLASGCATSNSEYQREMASRQFPVQHSSVNHGEDHSSKRLSLYDAITGAVNHVGGRFEKRAALKAYKACRTSPVFANYHVKQIYRDLYTGITQNGVELNQQQGFVFVSIPLKDTWPDLYTMKQVASIVAQNEHIFVFLPSESPFGYDDHYAYLGRLKSILADNGIEKDHIRVLPMELFNEQQGSEIAHHGLLPLKLCYG